MIRSADNFSNTPFISTAPEATAEFYIGETIVSCAATSPGGGSVVKDVPVVISSPCVSSGWIES